MKLSIAVSSPDAVFSALALKGSYEDNFALVKDAGFDGAELAIKDPAKIDTLRLETLLKQFGLVAPAMGTGRAFGEEGLCFSAAEETVRRAAVERICSHVDFGARLNSLIIIGLIVGKNPVTPETEGWAVECLAECSKYAAGKGVTLVVEPINRYETSFIINVDYCLRFLDRVGADNCKILLDTFHMNIEEASIEGSIRRAGARIGHVHVADSNRWHPGAGHIDFKSVVATLREVGYDGFLSAEILPNPSPAEAACATVKYLRNILAE
jgi:5-keto-L-gluconate epimerase